MKLKIGLAALISAAGLLACTHAQPKAEPSTTAAPAAQTTDTSTSKKQPTAAEFHAQGQADLDAALKALQGVSVFFEFDQATLTKNAEAKLSDVAGILVKHPELKVRIGGNADERGSEQYNLALGQRRADAARKYLDNLGVKDEQITAISFGAEKPKATGHDEDAWKQNRRDDVNPQK
jgi:peptidoglycan-associated lipoprotein